MGLLDRRSSYIISEYFIYLFIYLSIYLSIIYLFIYLLSLFNIFARVSRNSPLLPSFQLNEKTQIEPFSCNLKARLTQNLNVPRIRAIDATMQVLFSIFFFFFSPSIFFLLRFSPFPFPFRAQRTTFFQMLRKKLGGTLTKPYFTWIESNFPKNMIESKRSNGKMYPFFPSFFFFNQRFSSFLSFFFKSVGRNQVLSVSGKDATKIGPS